MNIGKRICKLRKDKKMTQQELVDRLFVTDKTISSWELGRTEPSSDLIIKLSEILDCDIGYLVYGNNPKSDVETEIKFKLDEAEYKRIIRFMTKNASFINESRQVDTYYQPTHRSFLDGEVINEWIRIGERGQKKILNYKNWHDNMYCDEWEVEIDNSENLDKIFKVLGLEIIAVVDKDRKKYMYLDKYEISLDSVKDLGYFIEIEVKKYDKDPIGEYGDLIKLAKDLNLNLNNIDKRGYPYHLIFNNKNPHSC